MTFRGEMPVGLRHESRGLFRSMTMASASTTLMKKADAAERPKAFHLAGLLVNEPPDTAGLLFI